MLVNDKMEFWTQQEFDITERFCPSTKDQLMSQIEIEIMEWLKDDEADSVRQIRFQVDILEWFLTELKQLARTML